MKKLVCLILAVVAVFSLTGCGSTTETRKSAECWAIEEVIKNYNDENFVIYKSEECYIQSEEESKGFDEQGYIITVFLDIYSYPKINYWYCKVVVKQKCTHTNDNTVCKDCVGEIKCEHIIEQRPQSWRG